MCGLPMHHCVRRIEKINWMNCARARAAAEKTGANLHEAPGISSRNELCAGLRDVCEFCFKHEIRNLGLDEIENSRAAAALIGIL